jgi:hypothetical protein
VVATDARMDGVVGKLQDGEAGRVLVAQDDEVVGIITPLGPDPLATPLADPRRQRALSRSCGFCNSRLPATVNFAIG